MAENETTTQAPAVTEPVVPAQPVEHTVATVDDAPILAVLQSLTEPTEPAAEPEAELVGTDKGREHEPLGNIANNP
jgi:hypothetical protein